MHILVDIIFKTVLLFFVDGQWEALALLLIGISVNQLRSLPEGTTAMGLPVTTIAYIYTLIFVSSVRCTSYFYLFMLLIPPWFIQSIFFKYVENIYTVEWIFQVTVPSFASVYNEYALKSQFETSIYLQVTLQCRIKLLDALCIFLNVSDWCYYRLKFSLYIYIYVILLMFSHQWYIWCLYHSLF